MSWKQLLASGRVRRHVTSKVELDSLRAVVTRDLQDASLAGLSDDRRFATAYNAVLQLAKMTLASAGYRVTGSGHHQITFEALTLAMGKSVASLSSYFETCRRKRNTVDYDAANVTSTTEADELVSKANVFYTLVERMDCKAPPRIRALSGNE
jgi:uncharacterized protein (UPF0332 family)